MDTPRTIQIASGIAHLAYGVAVKDKDHFNSPLAYDYYDLWFSDDYDYLIDNILDSVFDEIESDITSVDSTNLSEAASLLQSKQSSADRRARIRAGLTDSDATSLSTGKSFERLSTPSSDDSSSTDSNSVPSVDSKEENDVTTLSHEHFFRANHGYYDTSESSYSDTYSWYSNPYSGYSNSSWTSQKTGEASTVSTPSFKQVQYADKWANNNSGATVDIIESETGNEWGNIAGLEWSGDQDNEIIFGTAWLDVLAGKSGNDNIYGFEGDDQLSGGDGVDNIFGDGGNDTIYTGYGPEDTGVLTTGDGDLASGGSGDDNVYGAQFAESLFGGTGHDFLKAFAGDDYLHGGAGDDTMEGMIGDDVLLGDDGDDAMKGGNGNDDMQGGAGDDTMAG